MDTRMESPVRPNASYSSPTTVGGDDCYVVANEVKQLERLKVSEVVAGPRRIREVG